MANVLLYDPISFSGGSKKAALNVMRLLTEDDQINLIVYTANIADWGGLPKHNSRVYALTELSIFSSFEQGVGYFIKHIFLFFQLLALQIKVGRFTTLVGTSGPGVDLALYLFKWCFKCQLIQLIQGPVAKSRTLAECIIQANLIAYLPTCLESIKACLSAVNCAMPNSMMPLNNGLSRSEWPASNHESINGNESKQEIKILWAASLLKWKGLDLLLAALNRFSDVNRPVTSICYIKPNQTRHEMTDAPQHIPAVIWHEQPVSLDRIRSQHHIFVSTSVQEPFGLSILEAMAAGLVVVIPADGAFWDQVLIDDVNCIKYAPESVNDLYLKLNALINAPSKLKLIAEQSRVIALDYQAEKTYFPVSECIKNLTLSIELMRGVR